MKGQDSRAWANHLSLYILSYPWGERCDGQERRINRKGAERKTTKPALEAIKRWVKSSEYRLHHHGKCTQVCSASMERYRELSEGRQSSAIISHCIVLSDSTGWDFRKFLDNTATSSRRNRQNSALPQVVMELLIRDKVIPQIWLRFMTNI